VPLSHTYVTLHTSQTHFRGFQHSKTCRFS